MSKSTHLLWIAEAEARSLQDFTLLQHASSEPGVAIIRPVGQPARSSRWRSMIARLVPLAPRRAPTAAEEPGSSGQAEPARSFRPILVETSFDAQRT